MYHELLQQGLHKNERNGNETELLAVAVQKFQINSVRFYYCAKFTLFLIFAKRKSLILTSTGNNFFQIKMYIVKFLSGIQATNSLFASFCFKFCTYNMYGAECITAPQQLLL